MRSKQKVYVVSSAWTPRLIRAASPAKAMERYRRFVAEVNDCPQRYRQIAERDRVRKDGPGKITVRLANVMN